VSTATSAHEALLMLPQAKPDVLLSDIGMPDMDGYMLIQQVRTLAPEQGGQILAIALTAYAGETNQQQVIAAGFQKHIPTTWFKQLSPSGFSHHAGIAQARSACDRCVSPEKNRLTQDKSCPVSRTQGKITQTKLINPY
jgi:CheY-like chemotaxis protein